MGKWLRFWTLGLIWGSSYLFISFSVEQLTEFQVVFIRTLIAAIGLNLVLHFRGQRLPAEWKRLYPLIILGIGSTMIPFLLITWGEKTVESGLAGVLQSTSSLFSFIIAHYFSADERINAQKIVGLVVGFVGVIALSSRSWADGEIIMGDLVGQLAIIIASLCYATFGVYSRKLLRGTSPLVISCGSMTTCAVVSGILMLIAPALGGPAPTPLNALNSNVLLSVLTLGFFNTLVAYLLYYGLIADLGASRASMVTFVIPPVALFLGVLFRDEQLDARLVIGTALILIGIAVVNLRLRRETPARLQALRSE